MACTLIVTVDTEEEGLWSGSFKTSGYTVENTRGIPRFQECCERYGARPTYLVDTVIANDERSVELLKRLQDEERCEIGAHLHPWCGPPFEETLSNRNSFLCNLPLGLQCAKLSALTELIETRFGRRPTSFRAGRYGLDIQGARLLTDLAYKVDSSVLPFSTFAADEGPDFSAAPYIPYYIGDDNLCASGGGRLLEVPVSVGFSRRAFERHQQLRTQLSRPPFRSFRLMGILDRMNLVRRIKFSPEMNGANRLKQLVNAYLANGAPCMVLLLHSPSLRVGSSPYVPTEERLNGLYNTLESIFQYCVEQRQMPCQTLTEFAEHFDASRPSLEHHDAVTG